MEGEKSVKQHKDYLIVLFDRKERLVSTISGKPYGSRRRREQRGGR